MAPALRPGAAARVDHPGYGLHGRTVRIIEPFRPRIALDLGPMWVCAYRAGGGEEMTVALGEDWLHPLAEAPP